MASSINSELYAQRVAQASALPVRSDGKYVLYWMTAARRTRANYALQRARDWAKELKRPLLVLEALRLQYRWASERLHRFIIEGMLDNSLQFAESVAHYYPYVELKAGGGSGLVDALAKDACLVVTDDYPCFHYPALIRLAARTMPVRLEVVDSNCLIPLRAWDRTFTVAHSYRRAMQKIIPGYLELSPEDNPLLAGSCAGIPRLSNEAYPVHLLDRWPHARFTELIEQPGLAALPIDHSVRKVAESGGAQVARRQLLQFVSQHLDDYSERRNDPDQAGSTQLSPYLHFGHLSAHEVFWSIMRQVKWAPGKLSKPNGSIEGFWNVGPSAEALLDQLCTWREIGFNMCQREKNFDRYESLPGWAQQTLADHQSDPRPQLFSFEQLEQAQSYDPLWNAAQRQLVKEGRIHNYLRMLWGKRFLEWTPSAQVALEWMLEINNKYALDGRDPNSYSGIFWILGRYDRAWGPERPIYGKVRYMSSDNTAKKVKVKEYLKKYG